MKTITIEQFKDALSKAAKIKGEAGVVAQEAAAQRCGSISSMRLAGCVGNRSSTSLRYA